jgi:hypothetical protein
MGSRLLLFSQLLISYPPSMELIAHSLKPRATAPEALKAIPSQKDGE